MGKTGKPWLYLLFPAALAAYFLSEALLRQAAVARINPDSVRFDEILSSLPPETQEKIEYKMMLSRLRSALSSAVDPSARVDAMLALAAYTRDAGERSKLYRCMLEDFSTVPGAYPAYILGMYNDSEPNTVSMLKFHNYQKNLPIRERYYAWVSLAEKIRNRRNQPPSGELLNLFRPLLEIEEPPFLEYCPLYEDLAKYARQAGDVPTAKKAMAAAQKCSYRRTFSEYMRQMEEDGRLRENLDARRSGTEGILP